MNSLPSSLERSVAPPLYRVAQNWLKPALEVKNPVAIDATCGNGHDTLFLCRTVGGSRGVYGFDTQSAAIASTRKRLEAEGFSPELHQMDHAYLDRFFEDREISLLHAAIFNLGYLPGGDHQVITRPDSTVRALAAVIDRCAPGARVAVVAYRGHPGGREETESLERFLFSLNDDRFSVATSQGSNPETGPVLFRIDYHPQRRTVKP